MLRIEITSSAFETISGISKKTGQPFSFRQQLAHIHKPGEKYPTPFKINLKDDQNPHPAGNYSLAADAVYVDNNGKLSITPRLAPAPAAAATRAA